METWVCRGLLQRTGSGWEAFPCPNCDSTPVVAHEEGGVLWERCVACGWRVAVAELPSASWRRQGEYAAPQMA